MPELRPHQLWLEPRSEAAPAAPQDDVIVQLAGRLPGRVCLELSAGAGAHGSNLSSLVLANGWSAVIGEQSEQHAESFRKMYAGRPVEVVKTTFGGGQNKSSFKAIDAALKGLSPDIVSIRQFGGDHHLWKALPWHPAIVVVTFNPTFDSDVEFVQEDDQSLRQGASLLALTKLAASKGYALAYVGRDAVFVDEAKLSDVKTYSEIELNEIWTDRSWISRAVIGFDGRIFLAGNRRLQWNRLPFYIEMEDEDLQAIPAKFRRLEW